MLLWDVNTFLPHNSHPAVHYLRSYPLACDAAADRRRERYYNAVQPSPDWHEGRRSHLGSSGLAGIIALGPFGELNRTPALHRLLYGALQHAKQLGLWAENPEMLMDAPDDTINAAMQHGNDNEGVARDEYILAQQVALMEQGDKTGLETFRVQEIGVAIWKENRRLGDSPDGLVYYTSDDGTEHRGALEIKCPVTKIAEKLANPPAVDSPWLVQALMHCAVHNVPWCDFVVWTENETATHRIVLADYANLWQSYLARANEAYDTLFVPELCRMWDLYGAR